MYRRYVKKTHDSSMICINERFLSKADHKNKRLPYLKVVLH